MFPARLQQAPRILGLTLVITFISGANFFSIIMFWPTQAFNVYGHDPIGVGLRGLPVGFSILAGAFIVLWCLSVFRGRNKELMIISSIMMTAGMPISSLRSSSVTLTTIQDAVHSPVPTDIICINYGASSSWQV